MLEWTQNSHQHSATLFQLKLQPGEKSGYLYFGDITLDKLLSQSIERLDMDITFILLFEFRMLFKVIVFDESTIPSR